MAQLLPERLDANESVISVVVPAFNAEATIGSQIDALCSQKCEVPWQIVVVDNNSTDNTAAVALAHSTSRAPIHVVAATDGKGPAYARNTGVAATTTPWIAFCDADDIVQPGWLMSITDALEIHEFVSGPLDLDLLNPAWLAESRGRSFANAVTSFEGLFPYASSCNLAIHRDLFDRVGGFDERLLVGEDIDLSLRVWQHGGDLHFASGASVHYRLRPDLPALFRQSRQYGAFQPVLLERMRKLGLDIPSRYSHARKLAWLGLNLPSLRSRGGAARWLWVAGAMVGRLHGGFLVRRLYI